MQEKENYVEFLTKEVSFNNQLVVALKGIQGVNERLQRVEDAAAQQDILGALFQLEGNYPRDSVIPYSPHQKPRALAPPNCF